MWLVKWVPLAAVHTNVILLLMIAEIVMHLKGRLLRCVVILFV